MKREDLVKAYITVAEKYLKPKNQMFFRTSTCAVCTLLNARCIKCPSSIPHDGSTYGCMSHKYSDQLSIDLAGISNCYLYEAPTEAMVARAAQLLEASLFIEKELTDEELSNDNFTRIYPLLS